MPSQPHVHTEDEKTLVRGLLHLTDALEHAMHALTLGRPPEDPHQAVEQMKHLMEMTNEVEAAKSACGDLLSDEEKRQADEAIEKDRDA